jgi:hypothetical protein
LGAAAAAGVLPLVLFAAGFAACFLLVFFAFVVEAAGGVAPLAGGVAGDWANVKGIVATARAIVNKVVFIFFFSLRALAARSQSYDAADPPETR